MRSLNEGARGCGFRKPGGLYLVSGGIGIRCDLLPVALETCPTCGAGIKPNRGWQWVNPDGILPHHDDPDSMLGDKHRGCPLNEKGKMGERAGLLWIGEQFYATPEEWIAEGRKVGFSRRIKTVPDGFQVGVTWVLAGHRKAVMKGYGITIDGEFQVLSYGDLAAIEIEPGYGPSLQPDDFTQVFGPGVFHIWRPDRIEYVVKGTETDDELAALEKRGIEPVRVVPIKEEA